MNLPKAIKDRNIKNSQAENQVEFYLQYQNILQSVLSYDFSAVYRSVENTSNPLIQFLKENHKANFAGFLETVEKYGFSKSLRFNNFRHKKSNEGYVSSNVEPYKQYFDKHHPSFIDFPDNIIRDFNDSVSKELTFHLIYFRK